MIPKYPNLKEAGTWVCQFLKKSSPEKPLDDWEEETLKEVRAGRMACSPFPEKVSKNDVNSEVIKLMNGTWWAKYEGKWYGSFPTRVGAETWLEDRKNAESLQT